MREAKEATFMKDVVETFRLLISPRMLYCMPLIIWSALSPAAFTGSFVPLMNKTMEIDHKDWNDNKKLAMSLFAMIPLGVGEIIGALVFGKISDKFGPKTSLKFIMVITVVAFAILFATIATYRFNALTFVMTFAWGLQDATIQNLMNCILASEFDSKITPFSVYKFSQSLFIFAFLVVASKITEQTQFYIYFSCMAAWSILSLSMMLCFKYKKESATNVVE